MTQNQYLDSEEDDDGQDFLSSSLNGKSPLFTPEDEEKMQTAIKRSIAFMKNYGKGREPYMIDRKAYD